MHDLMKAVLAPGSATAKRFAKVFAFPGARSGIAIMEMLDACSPDEAHTGPGNEALWLAPVTLDMDSS
jgi:hypothetical protein